MLVRRPNRLGAAQTAHPRGADQGGAAVHRRGQGQRAGPGDHPGRRRRDGLVLQPLRQQGAAFRRCRRRVLDAHGALLDQFTAIDRRSRRDVRHAVSGSPAGCSAGARRRARSCWPTGWRCCRRICGWRRAPCAISRPAVAAGRFTVDDPELALAMAGGALLGLGNLLRDHPDRDDAHAADTVTEDVLRLFGMPADDARRHLPAAAA